MSSSPSLQIPPSSPQSDIFIPYKNVLFMCILILWFGPTSVFFLAVLSTILYGPKVTLPLWRQLIRDTFKECSQLYLIATHEPTTPEENSFSLRKVAKNIKTRFYDTL
jgi:hypothetical protein